MLPLMEVLQQTLWKLYLPIMLFRMKQLWTPLWTVIGFSSMPWPPLPTWIANMPNGAILQRNWQFFSPILFSLLSTFLPVYFIEISKSFTFNSPSMSMKFWNDFYLLFKLCMFIYFSCLFWYCRSVPVWNFNKNGSFVSQIGLSY